MSSNLTRHAFDSILRLQKSLPTFIEGHRGCNRLMPQNTLLSFSKAIEFGLDSIELDVWLTKDQIPVVIHGGDYGEIEEFTNGSGLVGDYTYEELSHFHTKEMNQKIPTLEEVFQLCKNKMFINIEMKDPKIQESFSTVIRLVERYEMHNQIDFSSFKHGYFKEILKYSKNVCPIEFGFLYEKNDKVKSFGNQRTTLNVHQLDCTPELVRKAHSNNVGVLCWFSMKDKETDEDYERLLNTGVDVICCNNPNLAKAYRDNIYVKH